MTPADSENTLLQAAAMQWPTMQFKDRPARLSVKAPPVVPAIETGAREALEKLEQEITEGMER